MGGMFGGGGGMSAGDVTNLAQMEAALNRNNTYSPIYGGTQWIRNGPHGPGSAGGANVGSGGPTTDQGGFPNGMSPDDKVAALLGVPQSGPGWSGGPGGSDNANAGPGWTQVQTLSPFMQQRFDLAQKLMGNVGGEMQGFDPNTTNPTMDPAFEQNQADQAFNYQKAYLDPSWAAQEAQMKGQLAAQGLHPGDPGYNQAMTQFQSGKNQAYGTARSGSYATGVQAGTTRMNTEVQAMQAQIARQLAQSGWSLGQINALMAGLPGAPSGDAAGTALLNPALQNSQFQQGQSNMAANNMLGAAATIGAAAISDVNAKEDFADPAPALEEFLESAEPSEYSYKPEFAFAGEGRQVSPMAQGLERSQIGRQMVVEAPDGTKMVDYGKSFGAVLGALSHLNKKLNSVMGL